MKPLCHFCSAPWFMACFWSGVFCFFWPDLKHKSCGRARLPGGLTQKICQVDGRDICSSRRRSSSVCCFIYFFCFVFLYLIHI